MNLLVSRAIAGKLEKHSVLIAYGFRLVLLTGSGREDVADESLIVNREVLAVLEALLRDSRVQLDLMAE